MESLTLEQRILAFLSYGDGYGYGHGHGHGYSDGSGDSYSDSYSDGDGDSYGDGYGYGHGHGQGDSYGYGYGYGDGIKALNGQAIYMVDGMRTLIDVCHDTYAMGRIISSDLTTEKSFVVKQDGMFAHGKTLREARDALLEKLFDDMPEDERIEKFMAEHKIDENYQNRDFFSWHHRLTGSCLQGRTAFAQNHGIDLDGSMTTREFLELTKDSYGGDIIKRAIKAYKGELA